MAESVALTKSTNGDFEIVVGGTYSYTKQFPRADYSTGSDGVKLVPYVGNPIMFKAYLPAVWTIDGVSSYTTNKQVTDAITLLANS